MSQRRILIACVIVIAVIIGVAACMVIYNRSHESVQPVSTSR